MKKLIVLFLAGVLCLSMAACAGKKVEGATEPHTQPTYKAVDWDEEDSLSNGPGCANTDALEE